MHILIPVLHRPTKPTGVCRHAVNLAQCLAETDAVHQVSLVMGAWQRPYFEQSFDIQSPKIRCLTVDIKNSSLARNQWFMFGLPELAKQAKPDIIHLSFPLPFVRQWFQVPIVSTIHDLYPYEYPENFGYPQVWFNQFFLRQCIDNSDGLVCVSKCTLEALHKYFPKACFTKKTEVIYNIVDFQEINSQIPQLPEVSFSSPFLLTVAQHRKNKNLDIVIQAYDNLLKTDQVPPETQLVITGSQGPETEKLQQLVYTLHLEKQVQFLSGLEDGELRWLYEHALLFVIASSTEGFCLPLVEALALSGAAVCSDIPIFREVGALNCRYFALNQNACHNLSKAIATELVASERRDRIMDTRFSKRTVSRQLLNFYKLL